MTGALPVTPGAAGKAEIVVGELALRGVRLPLSESGGAIFDADRHHVATVSIGRDRPMAAARNLAALIAELINAAGGGAA